MQMDGNVCFDYPLRERDRLDGSLAFGVGDADIRLRQVSLRNEP